MYLCMYINVCKYAYMYLRMHGGRNYVCMYVYMCVCMGLTLNALSLI